MSSRACFLCWAFSAASVTEEKTHPRTEAALERLRKAMRAIEAEVEANKGIYPYNFGRVTQAELCRRADVKKATLQNSVHKDTTRLEVMAWIDQLSKQLAQNRDGTRERVTAVVDGLADQVRELSVALQTVQEQLAEAKRTISQLQQENASLKANVDRP
ncbi:MAG: hypothetical protein RLZZ591_353 [Pseudomonadota bacterium]